MVGQVISKILSVVNKILAFCVLLAYALFAINLKWEFITNDTILQVFKVIMYYGPLAICSLVMLEFAAKRNIIIKIVVLAVIAVALIFQFFPDTFNWVVDKIPA